MSLKLAGVDVDKIMVGGVAASKVMVGTGAAAVQVWPSKLPLLTYTNDFNAADGSLSLTEFDRQLATGSVDAMPRISGNKLIGADATGVASNAVIIAFVAPKFALNYSNHRVEADLLGPINAQAQAGIIARANSDLSKTMQLNVVAASHGGISNQDAGVGTNRTSYPQALLAAGDRIGFEVYGSQYVAYRTRAGLRVNLTSFLDSGGLVPVDGKRFGFYIISGKSGATPLYGSPLDNFTAEDLPDTKTFREVGMLKTSGGGWPTNATWIDVGMVVNGACPGASVASNAVTILDSGLGRKLQVYVPYTGSTAGRTHLVRVVRVADGAVVATSPNVTTAAGVCVINTTINVVAGEAYKLQASGSGSSSGAMTIAAMFMQIN